MHLILISASFLSVIAKHAVESGDPVCGEPPDINFASLPEESDEPYYIGTTITYGCKFGYVISGSSRNLRCIRSGNEAEWTEPQFSCMPQSCGDPGLVTNAQRVGSLFTFPNSVTYYCDSGYKVRGLATRYCQTSGTWSGRLPVCEVIKCDPPKNPENGHVTASSFDYGSELDYRCDKGFSLNTDETVYCTEDGVWSKTDVACTETVCKIPETPEFGHVNFRGSEDRPRAGSIAVYSCEAGRIAYGPTTSKCLDNGIWTFPPPKCLIPCSVPYVSNGEIGKYVQQGRYRRKVYKKLNIGAKLEDHEEMVLRCSEGFEAPNPINKEMVVYCGVGKWSVEPICKPASCSSNFPFAANAEVVDINHEHGGTVSYECSRDYKKVIDETVICDHGVWRGEPPTCKSTKCSVHMLRSPGLLKGSKDFYSDGEVFEVTCNSRYQKTAVNNVGIMCEEGTWTGDLAPCVPASCLDRPPPSIQHGRATNPYSMAHGSLVKYTCEDDFVLVGGTLVQCAFGQWDGKPPECRDSRCYLNDLKNPEHVSGRSQSVTLSGNRLNIICDEGYSRKSKLMPLCQNGSWESDYESLCEESGCQIPRIVRGSLREEKYGDWKWNWRGIHWERTLNFITLHSGRTVSSGTVLWFYCDNPYSVDGNGKQRVQIRCLKGRWSYELQCLLEGEKPRTSTAASIFNRLTSAPELPRGSSPTTAGYSSPSTTPNTITVEWMPSVTIDGKTTEAFVTPQPSQEPPAKECFCKYPVEDSNIVAHADGRQLIYGDKVQNGSVVVFHCLHVGYHRFRGQREIICNDCQPWHSSDFPSCIAPEKGDAVVLFDTNINVSSDGYIEIRKGQNVNFTCAAMEIAQFPEWNAPVDPSFSTIRELRERKQYGDVVYLTHLQILNADRENEGTYECSIEGSHKTVLQVAITDPNLRCPEFPEDERIVIRYNMERRQNSRASFSCPKKGQELIGKPVLTCLTSGLWSDPPPYCSGVRCKVLKASDLLQIDYSQNREIGSYAAFHCPIPAKRYGASLTHCLENGTWADPTPTCRIPDCSVKDLISFVPQNVVPLLVDTKENSSLPYTSTVKLTCANDMVAVGNPEAKCGNEAKWHIDEVQCEDGCRPPTKLPSSKLILNPEIDIYKIGEKLTLSCPPGMKLNKESQVVMCMTSGWSDPIFPECKQKVNYRDSSANRRNTDQVDLENES